MAKPRVEAEELPYFTLLQKVPIKFVEWADKEIPTAYVIANCSGNEATYGRSVELKKKADFFKALESTLKPQAKVTLNYEEAHATETLPNIETMREATLKFQGKDILSRGGIKERMAEADPQFNYLLKVRQTLDVFQKFIDQNKGTIQKILKKGKFTSPWQVLRELMKDERLKVSFFNLIGAQMGDQTKALLLEKWESGNE